MFKLIEAPKKAYAEAFQSMDTKYSFVKKDGETITEMFAPTKCKDFLGDVLWAEQEKKKVRVWGFEYDGTTQQIDRDKCRILVRFPKKEHKKIFDNNAYILWDVEETSKISKTKFYSIDDKTMYVESDPFWLSKIWRISLLGYLMKCMCYDYKIINTWIDNLPEGNERKYMNFSKDTKERFKKMLSNLNEHRSNDLPGDVRFDKKDPEHDMRIHTDQGVFASIGANVRN